MENNTQLQNILNLFFNGCNKKQVAERLEISVYQVNKILKKYQDGEVLMKGDLE